MPALPQHPYLPPDTAAAKLTGVLPPQRNAVGAPIPAVAPPGPAPQHALAPAPPLPPPRPINAYPFDFWPARPWHIDPPTNTDASLAVSTTDIRDFPQMQQVWIGTRPYLWPARDEADWRGARFLGGGSYGVAGLWCQVDGNNNIVRVSSGVLMMQDSNFVTDTNVRER
jgi:hypothetical protein